MYITYYIKYHIYLSLTLLPSLLLSTLANPVPQIPLDSKISGKYAMASCGRWKMITRVEHASFTCIHYLLILYFENWLTYSRIAVFLSLCLYEFVSYGMRSWVLQRSSSFHGPITRELINSETKTSGNK